MEIYGVYQKYNRVKFSVLIYIKKKKKIEKERIKHSKNSWDIRYRTRGNKCRSDTTSKGRHLIVVMFVHCKLPGSKWPDDMIDDEECQMGKGAKFLKFHLFGWRNGGITQCGERSSFT